MLRECLICRTEFKTDNAKRKFCGRACYDTYRTGRFRKDPLKAFLALVKQTASCWLWVGCCDRSGYGKLHRLHLPWLAHRYSWTLFRGAIPEGKDVLHNCPGGDNPSCVNPAHLWIGDAKANSVDAAQKGRRFYTPQKLTWETAKQIRELYVQGSTQLALASQFAVSPTHVSNIVRGRCWKLIAGSTHK